MTINKCSQLGFSQSAYFLSINRNKRTIALDLSKPEGREVLLKLLAEADVLIDNFKTGTMEKWGIGYHDVLAAKFPRLVHARVSGFGADGPLGGFPGYDAMVQASAGLVSVNGSPESGPVRVGVPVVDLSTGMNACIGIMMALYERNRSGKGQFIDATLYDSAIALHQPHAPNYFTAGQKPKLVGNSHGSLVPYSNFPTKGRNIAIAAGNDGPDPGTVTNPGNVPWTFGVAAASHNRNGDNNADLLAIFSTLFGTAASTRIQRSNMSGEILIALLNEASTMPFSGRPHAIRVGASGAISRLASLG